MKWPKAEEIWGENREDLTGPKNINSLRNRKKTG